MDSFNVPYKIKLMEQIRVEHICKKYKISPGNFYHSLNRVKSFIEDLIKTPYNFFPIE